MSAHRCAGAVLAAGAGTPDGAAEGRDRRRRRPARRPGLRGAGVGCDAVMAVVRAGTTVATASGRRQSGSRRGMRSSLALAVDAARRPADVLAVLLVDAAGRHARCRRCRAARLAPGRIAVGRYRRAARAPDRHGARAAGAPPWSSPAPTRVRAPLLAARPDLVDDVDVPGDPVDLDRPKICARGRRGNPCRPDKPPPPATSIRGTSSAH